MILSYNLQSGRKPDKQGEQIYSNSEQKKTLGFEPGLLGQNALTRLPQLKCLMRPQS